MPARAQFDRDTGLPRSYWPRPTGCREAVAVWGMTLPEMRDDLFRRLARGVADRRSAFRTPALVTAGGARTIVLRAWDAPSRTVAIHSDVRAQKIGEIAADPRVSMHVWDAGAQLQMRAWGRAAMADVATADQAWGKLHSGSRASYRTVATPGTPIADPATLTLLDEDMARGNFAALLIVLDVIEVLHLARDGHRRARFSWTDAPISEWLVP